MSGYILAAAAIILVCLLLSKLSGRMGVPTLALFILLGKGKRNKIGEWSGIIWDNRGCNRTGFETGLQYMKRERKVYTSIFVDR